MRKIIAVEFITLDGVIQAPGDSKEDAGVSDAFRSNSISPTLVFITAVYFFD
jgi:hypothetical protein